MTRSILTTKAFRKDYKRSSRSGACDMKLLQSVIDLLSQDAPLPDFYREHALIGEWSGCLECHVAPDWLLLYERGEETLTLYRLGSHAGLFG